MDYVAIGYNAAGVEKAFTTGTLETCKAAAKCYRRTKNGLRVYPTVKIMTIEDYEKGGKNEK